MNLVGGSGDNWWKLSKRFDDALDRVSDEFRERDGRFLSLGSPVLIGERAGDLVRVPIILRGGPRELPVAYLHVEMLQADKARIKAIAEKAAELAHVTINSTGNPAGIDAIIKYG